MKKNPFIVLLGLLWGLASVAVNYLMDYLNRDVFVLEDQWFNFFLFCFFGGLTGKLSYEKYYKKGDN